MSEIIEMGWSEDEKNLFGLDSIEPANLGEESFDSCSDGDEEDTVTISGAEGG